MQVENNSLQPFISRDITFSAILANMIFFKSKYNIYIFIMKIKKQQNQLIPNAFELNEI